MLEHVFRHHPLLGTLVEVRIGSATDPASAARLDELIVAEIARLEKVFSAFDASSELERWKRGELAEPSLDFCRAMQLALEWQQRSAGAFNTASGRVTALWREAEARGEPPTTHALDAAARAIADPLYRVDDDGIPRLLGDGTGLNLNAFVKGWIVDRAVERCVAEAETVELLVNAGGDLRHRGDQPVPVGIEHPLRPYDNEPPIATIALANAGLATSGRARRGFRIAGRWYAHVIDPRTGRTVDDLASISVVAGDAATADVLATVAGLMAPAAAVEYAAGFGAACLVIGTAGELTANDRWRQLESRA